MIRKETFLTGKTILIKPETARRNGCIVSKTGVTANSDGEYIVKAGTPLYGTDAGLNRQQALTITASGSNTAQGVLYDDIRFENGQTKANGTLIINGEIDLLKLDEDVQALLTDTVKGQLKHIQFTKGRAD